MLFKSKYNIFKTADMEDTVAVVVSLTDDFLTICSLCFAAYCNDKNVCLRSLFTVSRTLEQLLVFASSLS